MKSCGAILVLLLASCLVYTSYAACNCYIATDECCNDLNNNNGNPTCYNPALFQCNGGNRLCPKGRLSCEKACYDPAVYSCVNNQLVPAGTQPPNRCSVNNGGCNNLACCEYGGGCYNPNHQACTPNGLVWTCFGVPANSPSVCGGHGQCVGLNACQCDPGYSGYSVCIPDDKCVTNNGGCGNMQCCSTASYPCYNPNHQQCTSNGLVWKCYGIGANDATVCGGHGNCTSLDHCSCNSGWSGSTCMEPSEPSGCNCYIATDKCCHDLNNNNGRPTCYNPSLYQCNDGNRLCSIGKLSCGKACYDPNVYKCVNGNLAPK